MNKYILLLAMGLSGPAFSDPPNWAHKDPQYTKRGEVKLTDSKGREVTAFSGGAGRFVSNNVANTLVVKAGGEGSVLSADGFLLSTGNAIVVINGHVREIPKSTLDDLYTYNVASPQKAVYSNYIDVNSELQCIEGWYSNIYNGTLTSVMLGVSNEMAERCSFVGSWSGMPTITLSHGAPYRDNGLRKQFRTMTSNSVSQALYLTNGVNVGVVASVCSGSWEAEDHSMIRTINYDSDTYYARAGCDVKFDVGNDNNYEVNTRAQYYYTFEEEGRCNSHGYSCIVKITSDTANVVIRAYRVELDDKDVHVMNVMGTVFGYVFDTSGSVVGAPDSILANAVVNNNVFKSSFEGFDSIILSNKKVYGFDRKTYQSKHLLDVSGFSPTVTLMITNIKSRFPVGN